MFSFCGEFIPLSWVNTCCNLNTIFIVFGRGFLQALRREDASTLWPLKRVQVIERFNQDQISEEKYNKLRQISRGSLVLFKSMFLYLWFFINWFYSLGVAPRSRLSERVSEPCKNSLCSLIFCTVFLLCSVSVVTSLVSVPTEL